MKYNHSLRNRIVIAFSIFGFILSVTYWFLIDSTMGIVEDKVFENRLQNEINSYLDRYRAEPDAPLPCSTYITSYIDLADLPMELEKMVRNLPEGFYETDGIGSIDGPDDYHLAVKKMPDDNTMLYLFYDVGTLKINERYESTLSTILFFISIIVTGIGWVLGLLIARKVIAPVSELADEVAGSTPNHLPLELSKRFADDEIGFLAKTLEQSMQRIQTFIQREKEFTRDVSHELRTPVTVIKGAIELITQLPVHREKSLQRPIRRIERSAQSITLTINTFLWLAREDARNDMDQTCNVILEVREAFHEHQNLFKEKNLESELVENHCPVIDAPTGVFKIVINNLLRNAFSYTPKGKIRLTVNPTCIELFNSAPSTVSGDLQSFIIPHVHGKEGDGFGFGLDIIKRLCDRFDWHIEIQSKPGEHTIVLFDFSSSL